MELSKLSKAYFGRQATRISDSAKKIAAREAIIAPGRTIPDGGNLPIGVGRRIRAAVMFLDISAFSSRPCESHQEQENTLRAMAYFFAEMIRIVEDYGGYVEKNTGDGLMAYFTKNGAADESASHRAVSAALTMFYVAEHLLNPAIRNSGLSALEFRICIDTGNITVAEVGAARRFHGIVAIGTTANIASKMLDKATAGDLLIGEETYLELPESRKSNAHVAFEKTGFVYKADQRPYRYLKYTGRWKGPL